MKIFCIIGKTGAGKDTVRNVLLKNSKINIQPLANTVDREIRPDEKNGVNHLYVSREEMDKFILDNRKDIMGVEEWSDPRHEDFNNRYVFVKPAIDGIYITTCSLTTYVEFKKRKDIDVLPIYLYAGGANRLKRAVNREGNISNIALIEVCKRFIRDEEDYSDEKLKEAGIGKKQGFKNDDNINCVVDKVYAYILANTREERRKDS